MNSLDVVAQFIEKEANKRGLDPLELLDRVHEIIRDKNKEYYY